MRLEGNEIVLASRKPKCIAIKGTHKTKYWFCPGDLLRIPVYKFKEVFGWVPREGSCWNLSMDKRCKVEKGKE
jgi:hypothetical protein